MVKSIRPYLEYQADRVEAVLGAQRVGGRITGGTVGPRVIRFFVQPEPSTQYARVQEMADDLAGVLRVPALYVDRSSRGIVLEFDNPNPRPVELLSLLEQVRPIPSATALIGLTDDGQPLLVRISSPEAAHCLVVGDHGAGKTWLLRTMAASLTLTHSPRMLRMVLIDPTGAFGAFGDAPHLTRPIVSIGDAVEALRSLMHVMRVRRRLGQDVPRVIVVVDDLDDLLVVEGEAVNDAIIRLVQCGSEVGIHVIAATRDPVLCDRFPLQVIGLGEVGDRRLQGAGDFLAKTDDAVVRFQAAQIFEGEIRYEISRRLQ